MLRLLLRLLGIASATPAMAASTSSAAALIAIAARLGIPALMLTIAPRLMIAARRSLATGMATARRRRSAVVGGWWGVCTTGSRVFWFLEPTGPLRPLVFRSFACGRLGPFWRSCGPFGGYGVIAITIGVRLGRRVARLVLDGRAAASTMWASAFRHAGTMKGKRTCSCMRAPHGRQALEKADEMS